MVPGTISPKLVPGTISPPFRVSPSPSNP